MGIHGQIYWGSSNLPVALRAQNAQTYFEHQDWTGTERLNTTYTGAVAGSFISQPFGDGYSVSGTDGDPYHFAMLDHDSETDTHHAQFRQYSSAQGHWMSTDPYDGSYDFSNPQSFNRYSYVLNNPMSFVDPSGLFYNGWFCGDFCFGAGMGFGGGIGSSPAHPATRDPYLPNKRIPYKVPLAVLPPGAPKSCSDQLADMYYFIDAVRSPGTSEFKGLAQRIKQFLVSRPGEAYADPGHVTQYEITQNGLNKRINAYRNSGCGEPPPDIIQWATTPLPNPLPDSSSQFSVPNWVAPAVVVTGGVACAIFVPGCFEVELATAPAW